MRYSALSCAILVLISACSSEHRTEPASAPVGFLDKVWSVVESPGGGGDLYVFLSDGTFVRASKGGGPDVGKWGWDGKQLRMIWAALLYTADIDSLTDSYFKLTFHLMNRSFDVALAPATASTPDTTRPPVEFDPTAARIIVSGHNPAFLFWIENDRATWRTARDGTLQYEGEWAAEEPGAWEWDGKRRTATGLERITLDLREDTCDEGEGAQYPFSASLDRGDMSWTGCAVPGILPSLEVPDSTK